MGAAAPAAVALGTQAAGIGLDYREGKKANKRRKEEMELENEEALRNFQLEKASIEQEQKKQEKLRRNLLKRDVSSQKALYGASGVNPTTGSANAVIKGLKSETEEAISSDKATDQTRLEELSSSLSYGQRKNLLAYNRERRWLYTGLKKQGLGFGGSLLGKLV